MTEPTIAAHKHEPWDWSSHRMLRNPQPCRICGSNALMTDCVGRPCHKVCAEESGGTTS